MSLTVTPTAAERLGSIAQEHDIAAGEGLRLFARGGGCACSGPSFGMTIDKPGDGDQILAISGLSFILDADSASALEGASIDYVDDVMRSGFTIEAPNAVATGGGCGCGGGGGH